MIKVGIQGGAGSFNDEAAQTHLPRVLQQHFELVYLYTTPNVLTSLQEQQVDLGQFATWNSSGGTVEESEQAIAHARSNFEVIEEYALPVRHSLVAAQNTDISEIDTIMGHPQALIQCKDTLAKRFPNVRCISGDGNLTDPSALAGAIARHELPTRTAVLGSMTLADHFGLQILDRDLQDSPDNRTMFALVKHQPNLSNVRLADRKRKRGQQTEEREAEH